MNREEIRDFIKDRLQYIEYSRTIQNKPSFDIVADELTKFLDCADCLNCTEGSKK